MEEASSPTDISSSLSEFVRKEKLLKELYKDGTKCAKPFEIERLKYNDEEIDGILQQMGRLLSPEEADNSVYKHVIEETENKSIEQILNEAKELVRESTPQFENTSPCLSTDDLSSEFTENEITFINIGNTTEDETDVNGNRGVGDSTDEEIRTKMEIRNNLNKNGNFYSMKTYPNSKKKPLNIFQNLISSKKPKHKKDQPIDEIQFLKQELHRFNQLYNSSKEECDFLKEQLTNLEFNYMLWSTSACQRFYFQPL